MRIHRPRGLLGSALSSRVAQASTRSVVKNIQRGTIAIGSGALTGTATITAADPNNSELRFLGATDNTSQTGATVDTFFAGLTFTNSTTITATRQTAAATIITVGFEVVEYYPGWIKSIQRGTIGTGSATVTTVNTAKSYLMYLGHTYGTVTAQFDATYLGYLTLASATSVTATNTNASANDLIYFQLTELY